ncbi:hypothetical protein V1224_12875 [Lachnospiraceae bacterium JLR.KK008]
MKENRGNIILSGGKVIVFLAILFLLLSGIQKLLIKSTEHRGSDVVRGFYAEKENDIDVVFLGSSQMFCTADPLVLYEEYGIASYDFGCSAQPFVSEYLYLKEVLRYQKPKVIGLEVVGIVKKADPDDLEVWTYAMTDLRFSVDKMTQLYQMLESNREMYAMQMLPILQYKDRWKELTLEDFDKSGVNYTKGAYTPDKITDNPLDFSAYYGSSGETIPDENKEALAKIVALCRENGIELFLFKGPNMGWTITDTEQVEELARQYDLPFVNYYDLLDELEVDPVLDFRDWSHFNRTGSRKASLYLGQYLKDRYDLPDRRGEDRENSWDIALRDRAHDRANEALTRTQGLDAYLNLIPYTGHTVVFSFHGDTEKLQFYKQYLSTVLNLEEEKMTGNFSIVEENGICPDDVLTEEDQRTERRLGTQILLRKKLEVTADGIWWDGRDVLLTDNGITIWVYDNEWGQLVDQVGFASDDVNTAIRPSEE